MKVFSRYQILRQQSTDKNKIGSIAMHLAICKAKPRRCTHRILGLIVILTQLLLAVSTGIYPLRLLRSPAGRSTRWSWARSSTACLPPR